MKKQNDIKRGLVTRRDFVRAVSLSVGALAVGPQGVAMSAFGKNVYPAQKITCIVSNPAGGGYDTIARGIAPFLSKHLRKLSPQAKGGGLVIKNEPGAAGVKAYTLLYGAKPDGYTIGILDSAFIVETLTSKLDVNLNKFTYLLQFNNTTRILVTSKNGLANWDNMMKTAQVKELKWGCAMFGRATHVDSIIIRDAFNIPAKLIPFGGTSHSMAALLRGDVQMVSTSIDAVKPLIDAGEIILLADFTGQGEYPGVPTSKDLGRPDLAEKVSGHRFFIAPPNLPKEISSILIDAFKRALTDPEFLVWANKLNMPVTPIYGAEAEKMVKRIFQYYLVEQKSLLTRHLVNS